MVYIQKYFVSSSVRSKLVVNWKVYNLNFGHFTVKILKRQQPHTGVRRERELSNCSQNKKKCGEDSPGLDGVDMIMYRETDSNMYNRNFCRI